MNTTTVDIKASDGPIVIRISIPQNPQALAARVFQYNAAKVPEKVVGEVQFAQADLLLGMPQTIDHKFFSVSGWILYLGDSTPSFYQVVIEFIQNGKSIAKEVPDVNGAGTLKDKDIQFMHAFLINMI